MVFVQTKYRNHKSILDWTLLIILVVTQVLRQSVFTITVEEIYNKILKFFDLYILKVLKT